MMVKHNARARSVSNPLAALAQQYLEFGWQQGDTKALHQILAPGFINHGTAGGGATRWEFLKGIQELYAGIPNFTAIRRAVIPDEQTGQVAIRWTGSGTHKGNLAGLPASNKRLTFQGIDILLVKNGRIVERWGESNAAQVMGELAAKTAAPQKSKSPAAATKKASRS